MIKKKLTKARPLRPFSAFPSTSYVIANPLNLVPLQTTPLLRSLNRLDKLPQCKDGLRRPALLADLPNTRGKRRHEDRPNLLRMATIMTFNLTHQTPSTFVNKLPVPVDILRFSHNRTDRKPATATRVASQGQSPLNEGAGPWRGEPPPFVVENGLSRACHGVEIVKWTECFRNSLVECTIKATV